MTALIGKKFDDGILILADKRITIRGTNMFTDDAKKIIVLNSKLILAYAGVKNIVDMCIDKLQELALKHSDPEKIIKQAQKLFCLALNHFIQQHPHQKYDTVYILAGFNEDDETFIYYFSSDDYFQSRKPLETFYKSFPSNEMTKLRTFLLNEVDHTMNEIPYYIQKFSAAVRLINHPMVGKNTYSIYLSKNKYLEFDIDKYGFTPIIN